MTSFWLSKFVILLIILAAKIEGRPRHLSRHEDGEVSAVSFDSFQSALMHASV